MLETAFIISLIAVAGIVALNFLGRQVFCAFDKAAGGGYYRGWSSLQKCCTTYPQQCKCCLSIVDGNSTCVYNYCSCTKQPLPEDGCVVF